MFVFFFFFFCLTNPTIAKGSQLPNEAKINIIVGNLEKKSEDDDYAKTASLDKCVLS